MTSVLTNPVTFSLPAAWNTTASQDTVPAGCPPTTGPVVTALLCQSSHTGDTGGSEQQGSGFTAFFLSLHPHLLCAHPVPWLEIASMCWLSDLTFLSFNSVLQIRIFSCLLPTCWLASIQHSPNSVLDSLLPGSTHSLLGVAISAWHHQPFSSFSQHFLCHPSFLPFLKIDFPQI